MDHLGDSFRSHFVVEDILAVLVVEDTLLAVQLGNLDCIQDTNSNNFQVPGEVD